MRSTPVDVYEALRRDPQIQAANAAARKLKIDHKTLLAEITSLMVGCPDHRRGAVFDFDDAITKVHHVQANLDRLTEIKLQLLSAQRRLNKLRDDAIEHVRTFEAVARLRTVDDRKNAANAAVNVVMHKLADTDLLLKEVEAVYWNLKTTADNIEIQLKAAGHQVFLLHPEKRVPGAKKEHL